MPKTYPAGPAVDGRKRGAFAAGAGPQCHPSKRPADPTDSAVSEYDCFTIPAFCQRNCISLAFYYKLKLQKKTPREIRLGNRRLISREAAEQWRREREAASAAEQRLLRIQFQPWP
jgi:hypothetical protein